MRIDKGISYPKPVEPGVKVLAKRMQVGDSIRFSVAQYSKALRLATAIRDLGFSAKKVHDADGCRVWKLEKG